MPTRASVQSCTSGSARRPRSPPHCRRWCTRSATKGPAHRNIHAPPPHPSQCRSITRLNHDALVGNIDFKNPGSSGAEADDHAALRGTRRRSAPCPSRARQWNLYFAQTCTTAAPAPRCAASTAPGITRKFVSPSHSYVFSWLSVAIMLLPRRGVVASHCRSSFTIAAFSIGRETIAVAASARVPQIRPQHSRLPRSPERCCVSA